MGSPPQGGDHQAKAAGASMGAPAGLALWQQRLCPKQPPGTQAHGHWSSRGQCDDHQVTPDPGLPPPLLPNPRARGTHADEPVTAGAKGSPPARGPRGGHVLCSRGPQDVDTCRGSRACVRADCPPHDARRAHAPPGGQHWTLDVLPAPPNPAPSARLPPLARMSRPVMGSFQPLSVGPQVPGRVEHWPSSGAAASPGETQAGTTAGHPLPSRSLRRWARRWAWGRAPAGRQSSPGPAHPWNGVLCSPHLEPPSPAPGHLCALRLQPLRARSPAAPPGPPRGTRQRPERPGARWDGPDLELIFVVRGVRPLWVFKTEFAAALN